MRRGSVLGAAAAAAALALLCGEFARGDVPDAAAPTRLAVIAQGQSAPCRGLADLLQVELSRRDGIELVEREEIDRVLAEQALTASGLVAESARIHLGALLKADGLLFVDQTVSTNNVFHLRLVETAQGYVAGFVVHEAGTPMEQTVVALDRSLANLSLSGDQRVGVSVLAFRNSLPKDLMDHPDVLAFMAGVEERLMVELAAIPGVLILERRKLGDVVQEEALSGEERALMVGTLVVDGGLTLGAEIGAGADANPQVALSFRLRNLATGESKVVEKQGRLLRLRVLEQQALDGLVAAAREFRVQAGAGVLQAEVRMLDDLIRSHYLLWAGEAAVALDGADRKRVERSLKMQVDKFDELPDHRAKALMLARVEVMCREHGFTLLPIISDVGYNVVLSYLKHPKSFWDPELRRLLQPVRTTLLAELDSLAKQMSSLSFDHSVEWLPGVVVQPSERRRRVCSWVEDLRADPKTTPQMHYFLSTYIVYVFTWGNEELERFGKADDPVQRFHANRILLQRALTRPEQIAYSNAMMADLDEFLGRMTGVDSGWDFFHTGTRVFRRGQTHLRNNRWPGDALRDLYRYRPEWKETVQRKLFERIKGLLNEKEYCAIEFLESQLMLTTIPERELFDWLNAEIDRGKAIGKKELWFYLSQTLTYLEGWRNEILARHPEFHGAGFQERVLLSAQKDGGRVHALAPRPKGANRAAKLELQRLLLDGDTLWVGVSGEPEGARNEANVHQWYNYVGLMEIDLTTGRLKSERGRWFLLEGESPHSTQMFYVKSMVRSGDSIILLHTGVGVVAFPVENQGVAACRLLGVREGLPMPGTVLNVRFDGSLVGVDGGVCIGLRQWLVYWDLETWQSRILLDMDKIESGLGYEDKKMEISGISYNPEMDAYFLAAGILSTMSKTSRSASYSHTPVYYRGDPLAGDWKEIEKEKMPAPSARSKKTERARQALKDDLVKSFSDVVVWRDQIIAICNPGHADQWKLSVFSPFESEDGDEN